MAEEEEKVDANAVVHQENEQPVIVVDYAIPQMDVMHQNADLVGGLPAIVVDFEQPFANVAVADEALNNPAIVNNGDD